ncbi:MAG TPA: hypothetical protein VGS14_10240 [Actinomycetes bacterium]|jgi:hypothetical protein|nr:hypothetical protein [Actinomycetes bacterium]
MADRDDSATPLHRKLGIKVAATDGTLTSVRPADRTTSPAKGDFAGRARLRPRA